MAESCDGESKNPMSGKGKGGRILPDVDMFRTSMALFRKAEERGARRRNGGLLFNEEVVAFFNAKYQGEDPIACTLTDEGAEGLVSTYMEAIDHMKSLRTEADAYKAEAERAQGQCDAMQSMLVEMGHSISGKIYELNRDNNKRKRNDINERRGLPVGVSEESNIFS